VALIEIVSEPVIRSAQEAASYARAVQELLQDARVINGGLEEGTMRMDVNVNWLSSEGRALTPRAELKNINGLGAISDAVDCELTRQERLLTDGKVQVLAALETRSYDPVRKETVLMRRKENTEEYRYLPEFDLREELVPPELVEKVRATMPLSRVDQMASWQATNAQLPTAGLEKLWTHRSLPRIFALALKQQTEHALFHLNWLTGPFLGVLHKFPADQGLTGDPSRLIDLVEAVRTRNMDKQAAKQLLYTAIQNGTEIEPRPSCEPMEAPVNSDHELDEEIANLIRRHPDRVAFAQSPEGRTRPDRLDFFVGPLIKTYRGRFPTQVILERLSQALDPE
jgi:aspartyl-tRNA(Asn)/glutamyl-tRNA(Gln) amidotransferase subunit B